MKTFLNFISESLGVASAATETFAKSHDKEYNGGSEDFHYRPDEDSHHHSFISDQSKGDLHQALMDHFKSKGFKIKNVKSYDKALTAEGPYKGTTKRYELHKDGNVFHVHHNVTDFDDNSKFHNVEISREKPESIPSREATPTFGEFLARSKSSNSKKLKSAAVSLVVNKNTTKH